MPGTKRAVQRGTARAVSCTRDALCGGEEADGCCVTKRSFMPGPSNSLLFEQKVQSLIATSTEFGSQSFVLETERDVPMSYVAVWSGANEPMCPTMIEKMSFLT